MDLPDDIFTEPEDVDPETLANLGPLRNQGLEPFGEPILRSEAVLISRRDETDAPLLKILARRLHGVMTARTYVMIDYDIRVDLVEQACLITPGIESPTVSPLHDKGFVAVRAMVRRQGMNKVMDTLYALGARGILITDIAACRI